MVEVLVSPYKNFGFHSQEKWESLENVEATTIPSELCWRLRTDYYGTGNRAAHQLGKSGIILVRNDDASNQGGSNGGGEKSDGVNISRKDTK